MQACKSNQEDTEADWGAVLDAMQLRREQLEEVAEARVALEHALLPIRTKKEVRRDLACVGSHTQHCQDREVFASVPCQLQASSAAHLGCVCRVGQRLCECVGCNGCVRLSRRLRRRS